MNRIRDLAISLRWVAYEERHRVVTALTESHGKVSALARNSIQSRRFGGSLEPFTAAQWEFVERPGADLFSVESAQVRRAFEGIRKDFAKLSLASLLNETMMTVAPEREPCPDLFRLHANALALVDEAVLTAHFSRDLVSVYLGKILHWAGSQPQFSACLSCSVSLEELQATEALNFLISDAGWVCSNCRKTGTRHLQGQVSSSSERSMRTSAQTLSQLRWALSQKLKDAMAGHPLSAEGFDLILQLAEFHLPGFSRDKLKSFRFLLPESNPPLLSLNLPLG